MIGFDFRRSDPLAWCWSLGEFLLFGVQLLSRSRGVTNYDRLFFLIFIYIVIIDVRLKIFNFLTLAAPFLENIFH